MALFIFTDRFSKGGAQIVLHSPYSVSVYGSFQLKRKENMNRVIDGLSYVS